MGVDFLPHAVGESIGGIDEDEVEAPLLPVLVALVEPAAGVAPDQRRPARRGRVARRFPAPAGCRDRPEPPARRRARAPRSPAPRSRSRGRGRGCRPPGRRGPRRSPPGPGPTSAAPSTPAARPGSSSQLSGDHSQGSRTSLTREESDGRGPLSSQWYRVGRAGAEPAAGGVEERPELGRGERAVTAQQRQDLLAGLDQERRLLGQLGDGEPGQAVLARPQHLALAAQAEVDLGELEPVALAGDGGEAAPRQAARLIGEQQAVARSARRVRPVPAAGGAGRSRSARRPRSPSPMRSAHRSRPRSRSWRRGRRPRPRRTPPSPAPSRPSASGRGGRRGRTR